MPPCQGTFTDRGDTLQTCTYCGSISVADAIKLLQQKGTRFSGSDWKYGWPHKFYIEPLNPNAGDATEVGSESSPEVDGSKPGDYWNCRAHGDSRKVSCTCPREPATGYWSRPIMGKREHLNFKFYNNHLYGVSDELFKQFSELSAKVFGISWQKSEDKMLWACPKTSSVYGFQLSGVINDKLEPVHDF